MYFFSFLCLNKKKIKGFGKRDLYAKDYRQRSSVLREKRRAGTAPCYLDLCEQAGKENHQ